MARCPACGCLERHRLAWLVLGRHTDLFDGAPKRLLHVAPERALEGRLRALPGIEYVSADLTDRRAMLNFDVTKIPLSDHSFDALICSHVLEHVPDDRAAMRELARVVKPSGWAIIEVPPLLDGVTFEDPSVQSPRERARLFGQHDHVRVPGHDYPRRLEENGWLVGRIRGRDLSREEITRLGLHAEEDVFLCRPAA